MKLEESVLAIKTLSTIKYGTLVEQIIQAAKSRSPKDIIDLDKSAASLVEFYYILQDMKFSPISQGVIEKSLCINGPDLIKVLNEIHDRPDVFFFFRDTALQLIDYYLSMRVTNWLLKHFYSTTHEKKTSSFIFFVMKEIEKYDFNEPCGTFKAQLKRVTLSEYKTKIDEVFDRFGNAMGNKEHFKSIYVNGILDNIRIVEKEYLPILFESIVLEDEIQPTGFHPNVHKRAYILFDIFRVLFPEKNLIATEDDYFKSANVGYISYYEYRVKTVEIIIGKLSEQKFL